MLRYNGASSSYQLSKLNPGIGNRIFPLYSVGSVRTGSVISVDSAESGSVTAFTHNPINCLKLLRIKLLNVPFLLFSNGLWLLI